MKLEQLLSQRGLVLQSPSAEEIRTRASKTSPIKLFYGETYDAYGNTIDSMKYYFFVADLAKSLKQEGFEVEPTILVADTAACRNVSSQLEYKYMTLGKERAKFVEEVNEVYGTELKVLRMSEYIDSPEFQEELQKVIDTCTGNPELMVKVEKSVPESKIEIERKKGFMYSFDEITTIIGLDVKIGPPREDLYDNIAREIAADRGEKGLMSLFLTPTLPLGMNWAYFFSNEGIENHGITAYKAGSKRLQDHRVLVGRMDSDYVKEQINQSFISENPNLPNPVLDVGIISEIARKRIGGEDTPVDLAERFYNGEIKPLELKKIVGDLVHEYVLSRF
jgi:hypothetical protein